MYASDFKVLQIQDSLTNTLHYRASLVMVNNLAILCCVPRADLVSSLRGVQRKSNRPDADWPDGRILRTRRVRVLDGLPPIGALKRELACWFGNGPGRFDTVRAAFAALPDWVRHWPDCFGQV